jgi:hypothetical protein
MEKNIAKSAGSFGIVWVRLAAVAVTVGVLAFLAPYIWAAASAGVGLLVIGLLAACGVALVQALPWLGQKLENRLLASRKAEARANPIEQLQNFLLEKKRRVGVFKAAVAQIGTQIRSLSDAVEQRKKTKPGYDASKQEKSLAAMKSAYQLLVDKYTKAESALTELESVVEDKKFEWEFGTAGQAAIQSLNATGGQELLDEMLAGEAFSSVRDNFNQVFSELELEASRISSANALEFDNGMSIDLSKIQMNDRARHDETGGRF